MFANQWYDSCGVLALKPAANASPLRGVSLRILGHPLKAYPLAAQALLLMGHRH